MKRQSHAKVRYAVVGLGWFAQSAILPAFANATDNSELAALVTGNREKAKVLSDKYQVRAFSYDQYEDMLASKCVDAVFIALPNSHHREYTGKAARAGVHVLCEKPMAATSEDCRAMIDVCARGGVRLMIAYRLHFERANLEAIAVVNAGRIGEPRLFHSIFTQQVDEDNFRLDRERGGGPLEDIGIYCINAARYLFRAEPTEVTAFAAARADGRFEDVPEMVSVLMRFPGNRLANFTCGFGESKVSLYRVVGTKGDLFMDSAYTWHGDITQVITVNEKKKERVFKQHDEIAPELLHFSHCIINDMEPEPSGLEGLIDVMIIEALHESYQHNGRPVALRLPAKARPSLEQVIDRPAAPEPVLVNAAPPGGN